MSAHRKALQMTGAPWQNTDVNSVHYMQAIYLASKT